MKTVMFINNNTSWNTSTNDNRYFAGVKAYAEQNGWNLQSTHAINSRTELDEIVSLWHPSGFILSCGAGIDSWQISWFAKHNTIFIEASSTTGCPPSLCIHNDVPATVRLAARELLSLGLHQYAYVGWKKKTTWSDARQKEFAGILAMHGIRPMVFDAAQYQGNESKIVAALAKWLRRIKEPIGIFAANDHISTLVSSACFLAMRTIPEDVAIIGIDDNNDICERNTPTLSSIAINWFEGGHVAAEMLDSLIIGSKPSGGTYPPIGVVRRQSTRRFKKFDKTVADAVELIRKNACLGLGAKDVATKFHCSRRSAEMRFRAVTGKSILEEIRSIRLERAKELIKSTDHKIEWISTQCGYKTQFAFSLFFRAETGMSPTSWRQATLRQQNQHL